MSEESEFPDGVVERCSQKVRECCGMTPHMSAMTACGVLRESGYAELVSALKKARPIVASVAELAKNANSWAQGIPLNALDEIDEVLRKAGAL